MRKRISITEEELDRTLKSYALIGVTVYPIKVWGSGIPGTTEYRLKGAIDVVLSKEEGDPENNYNDCQTDCYRHEI